MIQYAEQETKAEEEQAGMAANDPLSLALREKLGEGVAGELEGAQIMDEEPDHPVSAAPLHIAADNAVPMEDPGLAVPVTPPRDYIEIDSPREAAPSRPSDHPSEELLKKQRTEEAKRQRINGLKLEYEERLSAVKIAYKEYFTMDDYTTDLDTDNQVEDSLSHFGLTLQLTNVRRTRLKNGLVTLQIELKSKGFAACRF